MRIVVVMLLLCSFGQLFSIIPIHEAGAATQFVFASAGDFGLNSASRNVMSSIGSSGANFAIGVGDFLYTNPSSTVNEQTWCNTFKASIPDVELIVGNHETWETNATDGGGSINKFLLSCPYTLGAKTGTYGYRYYFDYPSSSPLARFILVDPGIWNGTTSSSKISYASGTANYNWVASAIDNARANSIPWVIVVMHKICIATGNTGCEVPMPFLQMLMDKRVDLVIQAHDHTYERSKQLTCATHGTYVSSCVVDAGSSLTKGAGTVIVIDGTGGEGGGRILSTSDSGYFAAYCCTNGTPLGYSLFTVTSSTLQSTLVNTGGQSYSDSFSISAPGTNAGFSMSASPTTIKVVAAHNANSKITVASLGGFTGTVTFSASPTPGLTATVGPTSVNVPRGGSASTTLTVSAPVGGVYIVNVTGTSGALANSVLVPVNVQDYSITANPSSLAFLVKGSSTTTVTVSSINGFSGGVNLSTPGLPKGVTASFTKNSLTVPAGGNVSTTLKVSSSTAGNYSINVVASGAGLTRSTLVTAVVSVSQPTDFAVAASPSTISFNSGSSATTTLTVTGFYGFSGTVTVLASTSPASGLSVSCSPSSITLSPTTTSGTSVCTLSSSANGIYLVTLSGSNGTVTRTTTVTVNVGDFSITANPSTVTGQVGASSSATVTITSLGQYSGTITLSTSSPADVTLTLTPSSITVASGGSATSTLTLTSNVTGNYSITITGASGSLSHNVTVTYLAQVSPDFTLSASPSSLSTLSNNTVSSAISITSMNGFNNTIFLSSSVSPSGLTCDLSPSSVTPTSNSTANSTLSCTASTAGNFTITVTGTSGSITHSTIITVVVYPPPDFTINSDPATLTFSAGGNGTSSIAISSVSGFNGTVSLAASISPASLSCTLTPTTIEGSGASTLSCFGSTTGTFTVTVTGTSGSLSHSSTVTVTVNPPPDFSITADPTSTSLNAGGTATSTITLSSLYGFTGTITLTTNTSPAGLTCSLSPTSVNGGTGTSTLSCTGTSVGMYSVNVTGTSGSIVHSTTVSIQVNPAPPPPQYALVTSFSGQVYKYQNGTLTLIGQPVTTALRLIAWKPDGSYALIVGDSAVLLKWDGTSLTQISTTGLMPSGNDLNTVAWSPDGTYALMGGTEGNLLRYDGTALTRITDPNTRQIQGISWNPLTGVALLVGNGGALFTYQNGAITILNSGTTNDLYGVAWNPNGAYALISGANGSILRWDGTTATALNTNGLYPSTTIVRYLAWNNAGTQALLVGNAGGLVLSYDGTTLTLLSSGTSSGLYSLAWSGTTATIIGNSGTMLTYSGGTFTRITTGTTTNLRGIAWKPA